MIRERILVAASLLLSPVLMMAQTTGVTPADLLKPLKDSWLTYNGDYTGQRFSALTQVDRSTVKHLTLGWMSQMAPGDEKPAAAGEGPRRPRGGANAPAYIVGGEGPGDITIRGGSIKGSILQVGGILYVTMPDNAWALDARDGHQLWHYFWKTKGGTHIGNRGFGIWNNYLYMETPDDYLVSLDARTGKERWHKMIADVNQGYFSTPAPIVIGNHVLAGVGNDIDSPGFLQSYDAETGELQWKHYTVPMQKGDPGESSWASLDAARHGGAQTWVTGAYDPETNLYIFGTGNPTPAYTNAPRGVDKDNLFTCSMVAVNVDTGKMAWYYQTSPHDMHDYDSAQTPVLVNGMFNGKMRKMVLTAARNGYFFALDRVTGEHLVTSKYGKTTNWTKGVTPNGNPEHDPEKDATVSGSLTSPNSGGTVNWQPPAFSPQTGLFYTPEVDSFSVFYLTDIDPRGSMGLGGHEEAQIGSSGSYLTAIDYKTGKPAWRHRYYGGSSGGGLLATAGGLVFNGDGSGSLVAHDAATGDLLWNTRIGDVSNAPQTYLLDGHQYVIAATGQTLWSFLLY